MRKLLLASVMLVPSTAYANGWAVTSAAPPSTATSIVKPVIGVSDAASASRNTSIIQAAINGLQKTVVSCGASGGTFFTNGHVAMPSNSSLEIGSGCIWKQAPNTSDNMIVSSAYLAPWTTLWNGAGAGIANSPLSMIWSGSTLGWVVSTAYSAGSYVSSASTGNLYWQASGAACTSAASGTGPTGTGSAITDGTCSWNYVTAYPTSTNGTNLNAVVHWPNHGQSVGNAVWITPQPLSGSNNYWSGAAAAGALNGPSDTAYFGVFVVVAVNDPNYVTVALRRMPVSAFGGIPVNIKQANQNITLTGPGTPSLDYDQANQASGQFTTGDTVIMAGVQNLRVDGVVGRNSAQWFMNVVGVANADIGHSYGATDWQNINGVNGDQVDIRGPAFDVYVHDMAGAGYDDILALAPQDFSHYQNNISTGDIINVHAQHISSAGGYTLSVYANDPNDVLDDIVLDDISSHDSISSNLPVIRLSATGNPGTGHIGKLTITHSEMRDRGAGLLQSNFGGSLAVDQLVFDHDMTSRLGGLMAVLQPLAGYTQTFQQVVVSNSDITLPAYSVNAGTAAVVTYAPLAGGTLNVGQTVLDRDYITNNPAGSRYGDVVYSPAPGSTYATGATLGQVVIQNSNINQIAGIARFQGVYPNDLLLTGNKVLLSASGGVVVDETAMATHLSNNTFGGVSLGIIRYGAAVSSAVYSGGGNVLSGGSVWFTYPAAGTSTVYGWDIQCDVTKLTRTTGEYCLNTNTAPGSGTLNTSGIVVDTGTAANSWSLLTNPTSQQY